MDSSAKKYECPICQEIFDTPQKKASHCSRKNCKPPEPEQASIPVSICPVDIAIRPEGKLDCLTVTGKRIGDRFIIDAVKMGRW